MTIDASSLELKKKFELLIVQVFENSLKENEARPIKFPKYSSWLGSNDQINKKDHQLVYQSIIKATSLSTEHSTTSST